MRPRFHPILFDLDGTIADTHPGIVRALSRTLADEGLPALGSDRVHRLTGRGVLALVEGALAELTGEPDAAQVERAAARYRELYTAMCAEGASLYPGVEAMLGRLPGPLALLTNKSRPFTEIILAHLGLAERFAVVVAGDDPGAERKPSPWSVEQALARLGAEAAGALFVGDSAGDARAGAAAGVATCTVRWGYGAGETQATYSADTVEALEALLWGAADA